MLRRHGFLRWAAGGCLGVVARAPLGLATPYSESVDALDAAGAYYLSIATLLAGTAPKTLIMDASVKSGGRNVEAVGTQERSMSRELLFYSEKDIDDLLKSGRFVAAVHMYSMDRIPLGEAMVRAVTAPPYVPAHLNREALGYEQLIQEVAERIVQGKIEVPSTLATEFLEVYAEYRGPSWWHGKPYHGTDELRFSQLRTPEARKTAFKLQRISFTEDDIAQLVRDERKLAAIEVYRRGGIPFTEANKMMYGDESYNEFDLKPYYFYSMCVEIMNRIERGTIQLSPDLPKKYPELYSR